jgi:serine/threonine protein kinase
MSSDSSDSSDPGRISPTLLLPETLDLPAIPDPEPREILQDLSPDFRCDGISSVVALAFHLDVPVLDGTVVESASGAGARIGSGAIATVALTRLTRDVQQKYRRRTELEMIRPGLVSASWLGRDHTAGQRTVVKRFFTDDRSRDELAIAEISQELRILGHKHIWQNRNVVDIIGLDWERNPFDILDGPYRFPVLLLEYGDCGTLEDFFRLEGIEYTWDVKVDLLYDIANGLETISDAGVCHGDLKLTNVLVFRNGNTSFVAKLCDFGSAVTSTNVEVGTTFRLKSVTPPWDAPESTADIDIDDIDKVDFYSYGLIACRVALEGGDPFAIALSEMPAASDPVVRNDVIKAWKTQDKVSEICKLAIRHAPGIHYTQTQHETLSNLIENTARTRLDLRADEYREIRALLKPEEVTKEDDW